MAQRPPVPPPVPAAPRNQPNEALFGESMPMRGNGLQQSNHAGQGQPVDVNQFRIRPEVKFVRFTLTKKEIVQRSTIGGNWKVAERRLNVVDESVLEREAIRSFQRGILPQNVLDVKQIEGSRRDQIKELTEDLNEFDFYPQVQWIVVSIELEMEKTKANATKAMHAIFTRQPRREPITRPQHAGIVRWNDTCDLNSTKVRQASPPQLRNFVARESHPPATVTPNHSQHHQSSHNPHHSQNFHNGMGAGTKQSPQHPRPKSVYNNDRGHQGDGPKENDKQHHDSKKASKAKALSSEDDWTDESEASVYTGGRSFETGSVSDETDITGLSEFSEESKKFRGRNEEEDYFRVDSGPKKPDKGKGKEKKEKEYEREGRGGSNKVGKGSKEREYEDRGRAENKGREGHGKSKDRKGGTHKSGSRGRGRDHHHATEIRQHMRSSPVPSVRSSESERGSRHRFDGFDIIEPASSRRRVHPNVSPHRPSTTYSRESRHGAGSYDQERGHELPSRRASVYGRESRPNAGMSNQERGAGLPSRHTSVYSRGSHGRAGSYETDRESKLTDHDFLKYRQEGHHQRSAGFQDDSPFQPSIGLPPRGSALSSSRQPQASGQEEMILEGERKVRLLELKAREQELEDRLRQKQTGRQSPISETENRISALERDVERRERKLREQERDIELENSRRQQDRAFGYSSRSESIEEKRLEVERKELKLRELELRKREQQLEDDENDRRRQGGGSARRSTRLSPSSNSNYEQRVWELKLEDVELQEMEMQIRKRKMALEMENDRGDDMFDNTGRRRFRSPPEVEVGGGAGGRYRRRSVRQERYHGEDPLRREW